MLFLKYRYFEVLPVVEDLMVFKLTLLFCVTVAMLEFSLYLQQSLLMVSMEQSHGLKVSVNFARYIMCAQCTRHNKQKEKMQRGSEVRVWVEGLTQSSSIQETGVCFLLETKQKCIFTNELEIRMCCRFWIFGSL